MTGPTPPSPPAGDAGTGPARRRTRLRALRLALGLALVAGALGLALLPRPARLEISWRLEEAAPPGRPAATLAALRPGQTARLAVSLRPGDGAPAGAALVCDGASRPRVSASAAGLVFDRAVEHLRAPDEAAELVFTVDRAARPGVITVVLLAEAELSAEGRTMRLAASARREVAVTVTAASAGR